MLFKQSKLVLREQHLLLLSWSFFNQTMVFRLVQDLVIENISSSFVLFVFMSNSFLDCSIVHFSKCFKFLQPIGCWDHEYQDTECNKLWPELQFEHFQIHSVNWRWLQMLQNPMSGCLWVTQLRVNESFGT